jgi:hypothetical protein
MFPDLAGLLISVYVKQRLRVAKLITRQISNCKNLGNVLRWILLNVHRVIRFSRSVL